MSGTMDELLDENARLRREVGRLEARVRAIESSRWLRLHPRLAWRRSIARLNPGHEGNVLTRPDRGDHSSSGPEPGENHVAHFRATILPQGAFTQTWFLGDVPQWEPILDELEGQPASILEVGSFEGLSASYLLWRLPNATITCIDTFAGGTEHRSTDIDVKRLETTFDANVALVDDTRVRKVVGDSRRRLLDLVDEKARFDLVYVDGSHLGLDVIIDAALAWQILKPRGTLVFDDYRWAELGEDPLLRPGPAIDAFLGLADGKFEMLFQEYQVALRKLA